MGKIKILTKDQGDGIFKIQGEKWQYLLKIENAEIIEDEQFITITATDGTQMVANKSHVQANNENFITYRIELEYGGGLVLLLSKFKKLEHTFEFKGYDKPSFKIKFVGNSQYDDPLLNDPNFNTEFTKKQFLSNQELPILFQGLIKNLFVRPNKGYLLFESSNGGGYLYFDKKYYAKLRESIEENYRLGNFTNSNAESEWMNLKDKIENAHDIINPNTDSFELYPVSK